MILGTETVCTDTLEEECRLVQDVLCRNVTETRFDEKCWVEEESECKTVYDTVWENKCELVNVTVPQRDCDTRQVLETEVKCRVENRTVETPVCVTVMDKVVDEVSVLAFNKTQSLNLDNSVVLITVTRVRGRI